MSVTSHSIHHGRSISTLTHTHKRLLYDIYIYIYIYINLYCFISSHRSILSIQRRFGFPNLKAIEEGRTGTDCRGEEHEVIIVWSITSGKRQIIMDGREIHFSSNRVGVIDFSWNAKGNHVFKTICNATPPLSPQPGYRQYDLLIDGQTFFRMPKVFELGVKGMSAAENRVPGQYNSYDETSPRSAYGNDYGGGGGGGYGGGYAPEPPIRAPRDPSEEDMELQRAIKASLEESKSHLGEGPKGPPDVLSEPPAATTTDLLDFDGPTSSAFSVPGIPANPSLNSYDGGGGGLASVYSAPPAQQSYPALPSSQPPGTNYGSAVTPYQQAGPYGAPPPAPYGAAPSQPQYPALPPSQPSTTPAYGAPASYQFPAQQPPNQYPAIGGSSDDPFAPKPPSIQDVSNDILKAYGGPPPAAPANAIGYGAPPPPQGYYQPGQYQPGQPGQYQPGQPGQYQPGQPGQYQPGQPGQYQPGPYQQSYNESNGTAAPGLSMNSTLTMNEPVQIEETPTNPFDAVLKKLVNFDHIDEPAEEQMKLTMKQQEDERKKKLQSKSTPLPPAAARVVGSGATLREISTVKPPTKKEVIMMPPAHLFQGDAAMAGALVEYGAPPPPLQPRGFGVVHMQGQYAAQPQAPPQQQGYGYGYR